MEKTIKQLASEMILDLKNKVSEVKELDLRSWKGRFSLVVIVIRYVESLAHNEEVFKEDKKELAIEIIDQLIDVPYIPDVIEGPLLKFIVGLLIDQVVEALNRTLGKNWIERVN